MTLPLPYYAILSIPPGFENTLPSIYNRRHIFVLCHTGKYGRVRRVKSRYASIRLGLLLLLFAILILPNGRSLYEGIFFYLRFAVSPLHASQPVRPDGRYASLYDLIRLRNAERYRYLLDHLNLPGVTVVQIPIPNYPQPDLFVDLNSAGPYTIYCAHYDKAYDDPQYQGASDNTAAVSVLLASITELARGNRGGSRAFLFSGQEESGLGGAAAFVQYARSKDLADPRGY